MLLRLLGATAVMTLALGAADATGTWKFNAAKSKYDGLPKPKEMTVIYTPEGSGFRYHAKGVSGEGQSVDTSWVYVKDGEDIQMTGSPFGEALVLCGQGSNDRGFQARRQGRGASEADDFRQRQGDDDHRPFTNR